MNRRDFLKTSLGAGGFALIGCVPLLKDGKYDVNDNFIEEFDLLDGAVEYKTKIKYKTSSSDKENEFNGYGLGFRKGNKLITDSHLINSQPIRMRTPFGIISMPTETLSTEVYFGEDEGGIIYDNEEKDTALIELPKEIGREYPLGDSDQLETGDVIASVGKSFGKRMLVKPGRVVSKDGITDYAGFDEKETFLNWYKNMPGDSGGPIYAFRDGEPEIIGKVLAMHNGIGVNHKINHIKKLVGKYL